MQLEIVTPVRRLTETEASEVVLPGDVGEFGVMSAHKPFLAKLGTGILSYKNQGKDSLLMISGGLAEVLDDRITVLAEYAQPSDEIDLGEAQKRLGELEQELKALPPGDDKTEELTGKVERWETRILVAKQK